MHDYKNECYICLLSLAFIFLHILWGPYPVLIFLFQGQGCGNWNMDKLGWTPSPSGKFWIYASIQYTYHNFHKIYP